MKTRKIKLISRTKNENIVLKILNKIDDLEILLTNGYNFTFWYIGTFKDNIKYGAIPFCLIHNKTLAHVT